MMKTGKQNRKDLTPEMLQRIATSSALTTSELQKSFESFWGQPLRVRFFSASKQPLYFWRTDDFFVSQLSLGKGAEQNVAQIRLSNTLCKLLLETTLGTSTTPTDLLDLKNLSPFEAHLLNDFSKHLIQQLTRRLIQQRQPIREPEKQVHLIWALGLPSENAVPELDGTTTSGKLVISLPVEALKHQTDDTPKHVLDENTLMDAHAEAVIRIGDTRLRLNELQGMEPGDIVVLDESSLDGWSLIYPPTGKAIPFKTTLDKKRTKQLTIATKGTIPPG